MRIVQMIKKNRFLWELIQMYRVRYRFGYLTTHTEVKQLYSKLNKRYTKARIEYDPSKPDKYVFIGDRYDDSTMKVAVFGDIERNKVKNHDCQFWVTHKLEKKNILHEIYWSLNKFFPLPFKGIWEKRYTTSKLEFSEKYNYFVIFLAGGYFEETFSQPRLWEKIFDASEKTFCSRNLYLVDPVEKFPTVKFWFDYFDTLNGCAWEDKEKYGLNFVDTPCVCLEESVHDIKSDIYIRAMDNGRLNLIRKCYDFLKSNDVVCDFHVVTEELYLAEGLHCSMNEQLDYIDMVHEELTSNVLLEIVSPGVGAGSTLRYREAVMYGKKLLTNNPTIMELEYYDGDNIRYFENVEDISIDWIRDAHTCEYNYMGDFSTDTFCERIKKIGMM